MLLCAVLKASVGTALRIFRDPGLRSPLGRGAIAFEPAKMQTMTAIVAAVRLLQIIKIAIGFAHSLPLIETGLASFYSAHCEEKASLVDFPRTLRN